jgi:hypothetical protein
VSYKAGGLSFSVYRSCLSYCHIVVLLCPPLALFFINMYLFIISSFPLLTSSPYTFIPVCAGIHTEPLRGAAGDGGQPVWNDQPCPRYVNGYCLYVELMELANNTVGFTWSVWSQVCVRLLALRGSS